MTMKSLQRLLSCTAIIIACIISVQAQQNFVSVQRDRQQQKVHIAINGKMFTDFVFDDSLEKPFLYPILAPDGETVTRGFPWNPQPNDPVDHPHHIGLWFNYENVNGLDFWNNSFAIPASKKQQYGWIRTRRIVDMAGGDKGRLTYTADWTDQQRNVLLSEKTTYVFSAVKDIYVIDRTTELTAVQDVNMPDAKDGMLGLRVAHELELPVKQTREYKDDKGNITKVTANKDATVTGNYLTSAGKEGDAAWGTRGNWCMLYGRKGIDTISIVMVDHPSNPGYPTYWHARNYGLFALNPLGQKIFSDGKETLGFTLPKGKSVSFRYRVMIASGKKRLTADEIETMIRAFSKN